MSTAATMPARIGAGYGEKVENVKRFPSDAVIARMDAAELDRFAESLTTDEDRERLSDALLRINFAWLAGAHSENRDTRRNRRIRQENSLEAMAEAAGVVIPAPPPDLTPAINRAAEACLDRRDCLIWAMWQTGSSQASIAKAMHLTQGYISQRISKARAAIAEQVEREPLMQFCQSMKRRLYHNRNTQDPLPAEIEQARRIVEQYEDCQTWILPERPRRVYLVKRAEDLREITDITTQPFVDYRELLRRARKAQGSDGK